MYDYILPVSNRDIETRNLLVLAMLHDIGAYKTEEIDLFPAMEFGPAAGHRTGQAGGYDRIMEEVPFTKEEKESMLRMLIYAIDFRGPHTVTHTITTSVISFEPGRRLCGEQEVINDVCCGAMLHDLGKIGIPVEILEYPGKLSPQAVGVMKTHVDLTEHILGGSVSGTVKQIALRHHEKLDGSGYPLGLKAQEPDAPQRICGHCGYCQCPDRHQEL